MGILKKDSRQLQLMNQKIYTLLEEDGVNNLDKIKELTRSIQRIKRAR